MVSLVCASVAGAQTVYDDELARGMVAHQEQRWLDARAHFEVAHSISPNARTLRGMGVAAFEAGLFALAVRDLEEALVHPERPLPPQLAEAVRALADEAWPRVGAYNLRLVPEHATLTVDGKPPVRGAAGELLLDVGLHELVVHAQGYDSQALTLRTLGGERQEMRITLSAQGVEVHAPVDTVVTNTPARALDGQGTKAPLGFDLEVSQAARSPRDVPRADVNRLRRGFAISTSAASALLAASSGTLYALAQARVRDIAEDCKRLPEESCTQAQAQRFAEREHLERLERGVNATWALAATFAVTATVLWVLDVRARRKSRPSAALPLVVQF